MDSEQLVRALEASVHCDDVKAATNFLDEAIKCPGYASALLNIINNANFDISVRQSAAICLKNAITRNWQEDEDEKDSIILTNWDKEQVRQNIVESVVHICNPIRIQLCIAAGLIMRHDFPERWPNLLEMLIALLQSNDGSYWLGAVLLIRRLIKLYEYRRVEDKRPLVESMRIIMPKLLERLGLLINDNSQESCLLQHITLKIFYGSIHFSLNMDTFDIASLHSWLEKARLILERPIPDELRALSRKNGDSQEIDLDETVWWKCKKWAAAILHRVFERYGLPGQVEDDYKQFAESYMANHALIALHTCLKILDGFRQGEYVSSRVLNSIFLYISIAMSPSRTWKALKPHYSELLSSVIFPVFKLTEEEEDLWKDCAEEFVRLKYDVIDGVQLPLNGATTVLRNAVKRKDILQLTLEFVLAIIGSTEKSVKEKEAALHILGELSTVIKKNKKYRRDVEKLIDAVFIPFINHESPFLRARACSSISEYASAKFSSPVILQKIFDSIVCKLLEDNEELPVKIEAALCLQQLLYSQENYAPKLKPYLRKILLCVVDLVARAEIEEMTGVIETILGLFEDELIPNAEDLIAGLAGVFLRLTDPNSSKECQMVTALGILTVMDSVISKLEENHKALHFIEQHVRSVILAIFERNLFDYYEEAMELTRSLISHTVSEPMWEVFHHLHRISIDENSLYLIDMLPALHAYITKDTDSFLARPERLTTILDIALKTFEGNFGNSSLAAKLLEFVVLQCQGRVNEVIPNILDMVLNFFVTTTLNSAGNESCLTVLEALIYYDVHLFIKLIQIRSPSLLAKIIHNCICSSKNSSGIHERKLIALAFCNFMRLESTARPSVIDENIVQINESLLQTLFDLQQLISLRAEARMADDKSSDEEGSEDFMDKESDLGDSEDEIDDEKLEYLEKAGVRNKKENDSERTCDSSDDENFQSDITSDSLETPIDSDLAVDVFIYYAETLEILRARNEQIFQYMMSNVSEEKAALLKELLANCQKRRLHAQSREVEQQGGYVFDINAPVPTSFNFNAN